MQGDIRLFQDLLQLWKKDAPAGAEEARVGPLIRENGALGARIVR
jgi:hypothetical protein